MIFSAERELHRLIIQIVLYMACSRQLKSAKRISMDFVLSIWWILMRYGDIEEIRKDTDMKLRSLIKVSGRL